MTVGERIRAARRAKGMTQKELAEKMGTSYVVISQWENGKRNPKLSTLEEIAKALEVPVLALIGPMDSALNQEIEALENEKELEGIGKGMGLMPDEVKPAVSAREEKAVNLLHLFLECMYPEATGGNTEQVDGPITREAMEKMAKEDGIPLDVALSDRFISGVNRLLKATENLSKADSLAFVDMLSFLPSSSENEEGHGSKDQEAPNDETHEHR